MKPKKPASPEVTPPERWKLHSPFGALKTLKGESLERLEDVHALLMERDGLASAEAAARVFGPFISDANSELGMKHGAAKLRPFLHIVDPSYNAESISGFAGRRHLDKAASSVPYVQHPNFESGTPEALLHALGVMAGEVWAPHSGDVDLNERLGDDCPEGYFPTAAKCREIVGPLAVPFALAHALWDWGTIAGAATVDSKQPVPDTQPKAESEEQAFKCSGAFISLCESRKGRGGEVWTDAEKNIMWAEICMHPNRTPGLRAHLAELLGLRSEEALSKLVRDKRRPSKSATVTLVKDGKKQA